MSLKTTCLHLLDLISTINTETTHFRVYGEQSCDLILLNQSLHERWFTHYSRSYCKQIPLFLVRKQLHCACWNTEGLVSQVHTRLPLKIHPLCERPLMFYTYLEGEFNCSNHLLCCKRYSFCTYCVVMWDKGCMRVCWDAPWLSRSRRPLPANHCSRSNIHNLSSNRMFLVLLWFIILHTEQFRPIRPRWLSH